MNSCVCGRVLEIQKILPCTTWANCDVVTVSHSSGRSACATWACASCGLRFSAEDLFPVPVRRVVATVNASMVATTL